MDQPVKKTYSGESLSGLLAVFGVLVFIVALFGGIMMLIDKETTNGLQRTLGIIAILSGVIFALILNGMSSIIINQIEIRKKLDQ